MADTVDSTSKKIAILGQNTESPPQGAALKLQQSIRNYAAQYIKRRIVSLPSLPSEEQVAEFQERRRYDFDFFKMKTFEVFSRLEIERRIEEERRKELEEERRRIQDERSPMTSMSSRSKKVYQTQPEHVR